MKALNWIYSVGCQTLSRNTSRKRLDHSRTTIFIGPYCRYPVVESPPAIKNRLRPAFDVLIGRAKGA